MAVKSLIETVTLGAGGVASIVFSEIPQDGDDLQLVLSLRSVLESQLSVTFIFQPGNAAQDMIRLTGDGTYAVSYARTGSSQTGVLPAANSTANTFSNASLYISNYASSADKSMSYDGVSENNGTSSYAQITAGRNYSGTPITTLGIAPSGNVNLAEYSSASLYKIKYD
jgi:hypothetical protein